MTYLLLFYEFFKTGLFAIGGGMATIPFLYEISQRYPSWFSEAMILDMIAISESTPGPIGINMATYAGFRTAGVLGGVVATTGLVLPSIIIIIIIANFLERFKDSQLVKDAFYGLRPAVTALIAAAGFNVIKVSLLNLDLYQTSGMLSNVFNIKGILLFAVLFFLTNKIERHPVVYIGAAALFGVCTGNIF